MRLVHLIFRVVLVSIFGICLLEGIAESQTQATATKDPQAISVLNQSLNAIGGLSAIAGIQDYTGSGTITYYWADQPVQAPVTIRGMGLEDYRVDASLPEGTRTWACSDGISGVLITPDGQTQASPFYNLMTEGSRTLPYVRIAAEVMDSSTSIEYVGLVTTKGQQDYQIHFSQTIPTNSTSSKLANLGEFDLYIDPISHLVTKLTETVRSETDFATTFLREIDFSNYQSSGNVLIPFSISEEINGQETWSIALTSVTFNSGLTDAIFNPLQN
ncbi:MAG TPA: hypothetical protein VJR23_03620 [Candidatus Acidoferrales bacterium]|nr:hypothetical protein [Candidatus Acidoferrales bacterium]